MTIRLGPFELHAPLGKGGMGVVWEGRHAGQDLAVAVKVITEKIARDEHYLKAFRKETAAVARLDHPGVVWLYDAGQVSRQAARDSYGQLVEGSPYLVMERADRGTLATLEVRSWAELREIAGQLLRALAHAHSRGVVHKDLKPANILRFQGDSGERLKLTDFGIAHALDATETATRDQAMGTLHYMSPEQIRAAWREYGPWTDLYSLGNLLWKLATGAIPFPGKAHAELLHAQLHQVPSGFSPRFPVPVGLLPWLSVLLRKDPCNRFQCAADALASFEPVASDLGPADLDDPEDDPTDVATRDELHRLAPPGPAPMLESWRTSTLSGQGRAVLGAGRGLFGLRQLPLVGREDECGSLWRQLVAVHADRACRVVLVRGDVGVGKTRLVDWLAERAHEVGVASVLRCRCSPSEHPERPLQSMLNRWARAAHLDPEARAGRVASALRGAGVDDPVLVERICELCAPDGPIDAESRHEELVALITALGRVRPVVLVVDDAQWGMDALRLSLRLVSAVDTRALVLLAIGDELVTDRTVETGLLEELSRQPRVATLALGPLGSEHRLQLVQGVLGLSPELARRVAGRSRGNPLFAVQLIATLVVHDLLLPGETGFQIRVPPNDAPLEIRRAADFPANLGQLWRERLERLFEELPPAARSALERAAALGMQVDSEAWQQVCDDPGGAWADRQQVMFVPQNARVRHQLLERLVRERLVEETPNGWVFAHGQLRDLLERLARDAGRFDSHHAACAAFLTRFPDSHGADTLGLHLLDAGQIDPAIGLLLGAARQRARQVGNRAGLGLLVVIENALISWEIPKADPRWGRIWLERSALYARLGNAEEALRWARRVEASAVAYCWPDQAGTAAIAAGVALLVEDRLTEARGELARGMASLDAANWFAAAVGQAWSAVAAARLGLGPEARARVGESEALFAGEPEAALAAAWEEIARAALGHRENAAAETAFQRSAVVWQQLGNRIAARAARASAAAAREGA